MTPKYIHCNGCGQDDKTPMTLIIAASLEIGTAAKCPACGHNAVITDGTDVAQPIAKTPEVELPPEKTVAPPRGDKVVLTATVKITQTYNQKDFTGFKLVREDGHGQWEDHKHQLLNQPEFRKQLFLRNVHLEDFELEIEEQTPPTA